ncbi:uncharacterized protein RAG0_10967 [Rhynchosporium agropyri]|uniref:Uncharacterized protein n=1 Tax=Rhynchosporium agropyri TaxID=914238 RepID=A0A1E1L214_9HELO|nr:uncharacterized protein RAG0_10967 [Rhynchosporium agropyri]
MYWSPTTIFSQDPASPANIFNDLILMASTPSTIIITKNAIFTPRDKHEFTGILFGHPGRAFFRRPISLGSPEKPNLDDTVIDGQGSEYQTTANERDSAKDLGSRDTERPCKTLSLEESSVWVDELLAKYPGSDEEAKIRKRMIL